MTDRVVVDPITRIEGHLRIEAQMDGDRIGQAYSSGTMVFEHRPHRDADQALSDYLDAARTILAQALPPAVDNAQVTFTDDFEDLRWFTLPHEVADG